MHTIRSFLIVDIILFSGPKASFRVLGKADMIKRQHDKLQEVTSVLGISDEDAARVLRKFKW